MEQFNKALSFILGLVVVAVFIVVASGKINFKNLTFPKAKIATKATLSPTPTPNKTQTTGGKTVNNQTVTGTQQNANYHAYSSTTGTKGASTTPTSIPNTGVPIVLFPALITSLSAGIFLRSSGKK